MGKWILIHWESVRKTLCIVCEINFSEYWRYDLSRHDEKHQAKIQEKETLVPGSKLRKGYVVKKKEDITNRQNLFVKKRCDNFSMLETSYDIAIVLAKKHKPLPDVEVILKPSFIKNCATCWWKYTERKVNEVPLSNQITAKGIEELSHDSGGSMGGGLWHV